MYIHILIYMYIHTYIYAYFHTYIYMYIYVVSIRLAHMWIAIVGQHLLHSTHEAGVRMQFSRTCEVCCSAHVNWDLLSQFTCSRACLDYRNSHVGSPRKHVILADCTIPIAMHMSYYRNSHVLAHMWIATVSRQLCGTLKATIPFISLYPAIISTPHSSLCRVLNILTPASWVEWCEVARTYVCMCIHVYVHM